jgi:hypothetical protein
MPAHNCLLELYGTTDGKIVHESIDLSDQKVLRVEGFYIPSTLSTSSYIIVKILNHSDAEQIAYKYNYATYGVGNIIIDVDLDDILNDLSDVDIVIEMHSDSTQSNISQFYIYNVKYGDYVLYED